MSSMGYKDTFESTVVANLDFDQKLDFITKRIELQSIDFVKNWSYNSKYRLQGYNTYQLTDYTKNEDGIQDQQYTFYKIQYFLIQPYFQQYI